MFTSFNNAFKSKSLREQRVPDVTLKYLSESLPKGVKYVSDENGNLMITSSGGSAVTYGGFSVIITDEMKKTLGNQCSPDRVAKYVYNTQKKIEIKLVEDGMLLVNGEKVPIEKINYNMFDNFSYVNSKFYMVPPEFPDPFELELGCEKYKRKLMFQRIPYPSISESKFKSISEDPLRMEFIMREEDYSVQITIGFDLKKVSTIRDIVETVFIYNAFVDGKGKIMEMPVGRKNDNVDIKKYDEASAKFWEKVLMIEEKINVKFVPPQDDVDFKTMCIVEQLYQNLILMHPTKENEIITSITSDLNLEDGVNLDEMIDEEIFFKYKATVKFELFGQDFSLPAILGIFNSMLKSYETVGDETKIVLAEKNDSKHAEKPFTSVLCFVNDNVLNDFVEKQPDCYKNLLEKAKYPEEYL